MTENREHLQRDRDRCDYGNCEAPAVSLVGYSREWRPMCARHAGRVMSWDARLRVRILGVQGKARYDA